MNPTTIAAPPTDEAKRTKRHKTKPQQDDDPDSLVEEYGATPPYPQAHNAAPPPPCNANKTAGPPLLSMPVILGELSPSPPISPSPAPTRKTRSSTAKVNCMLDILRTASPIPSPVPDQEMNTAHPTPMTLTPQCKEVNQGPGMDADSPPTRPANNRLPRFNQVLEAANLQPPKTARCTEQKDPLDKYSSGITLTIHDAYPGSVYARIKQDVLDDWITMDGETLLAIPFGSDAETPELHNDTCDRIFDAIGEITNSKTYGVASPVKKEELQALIARRAHQAIGQKRKNPDEHLPGTFLIHSLSKIHYQMLMQQTVWALQNITFRVTSPELSCPEFLFAIKGLRTPSAEQVQDCIQNAWNDDESTIFFQNGITSVDESKRDKARRSIQMFKESMKVKTLKTKGEGGSKKPTFNVYANGNFINDSNAWSNIRSHLAEKSYYNSKFGKGENITIPNHCGLCHGIDHPQGMCPSPGLEGWKGPTEMHGFPQKTDRYSHNSGHFTPGVRY